ncbi:MAG TPA: chemotaxis-specific protein-glutamate methyltransferase CheB [Candidatus Lokiarchaeia archaeon]|nr:chemotaxis-specific protein-glutamate methyltransferase CheB [Candidatus Lokiarchaeia archaeon]
MAVRVLLAEDSSFQRKIIGDMLSEESTIELVGSARNGEEAIEMVDSLNPDVLILDLVMPKVDGITAFKKIMKLHPIPVIFFSVLDPATMDNSVQGLLLGAVDFIVKPGGVWKEEFPKFRETLIKKIQTAAKSQIKNLPKILDVDDAVNLDHESIEGQKKKVISSTKKLLPSIKKTNVSFIPFENVRIETNIVVIGASVGGPSTIRKILTQIPEDFPAPIMVVQHINAEFANVFADALNTVCHLRVKVGEDGEYILPGTIYIAPGHKHMEISVKDRYPCVKTFTGELVNFCIPSIDVLFLSAPRVYRNNVLGVLLTGMGNDGVDGLELIQKTGGQTVAESKETCILYGMPKIADERGVADRIVPNYEIHKNIIEFARKL